MNAFNLKSTASASVEKTSPVRGRQSTENKGCADQIGAPASDSTSPYRTPIKVKPTPLSDGLVLASPDMQEFLMDNENGLYDHCRGGIQEETIPEATETTENVENIDNLLQEDILSPTPEVREGSANATIGMADVSHEAANQCPPPAVFMPQIFMPYGSFNYQQSIQNNRVASNSSQHFPVAYYPTNLSGPSSVGGYVQQSQLVRPGTTVAAPYPGSSGPFPYPLQMTGYSNAMNHGRFAQHSFAGASFQGMTYPSENISAVSRPSPPLSSSAPGVVSSSTPSTAASLSDRSAKRKREESKSNENGARDVGIIQSNVTYNNSQRQHSGLTYNNSQRHHSGHLNLLCNVSVALAGKNPVISCTCKKSRCLKLYCDCFQAGKVCHSSCLCISCLNTNEESTELGQRTAAIQTILSRRPDAFRRRNKNADKGCACKKSNCLKKYCICFSEYKLCDQRCVCEDCHNTGERRRQQQLSARQASTSVEIARFDHL